MTEMKLLEAIGMIDEELIIDAEQATTARVLPPVRMTRIRRLATVAACLAVILGGTALLVPGMMQSEHHDGPDQVVTVITTTTADLGPEASMTSGMTTTTAATATTTTPGWTTTTAGEQETSTAMTSVSTTTPESPVTTNDPPIPEAIYDMNMNLFGNQLETDVVLSCLDWTPLTFTSIGMASDPKTSLRLQKGLLSFDATAGGGCYAVNLAPEALDEGYTLEFDLRYTSAQGALSILTEFCLTNNYAGTYATYHYISLIPNGWFVYEGYTMDQPSISGQAAPNVIQNGLLDVAPASDLAGTTVTVRIVKEPGEQHEFYLKTETMTKFVKVEVAPIPGINGGEDIVFCFSEGTTGYLDNIKIY